MNATALFEKNRLGLPFIVLMAALIVKAAVLFVGLPAISEVLSPKYAIGFADDYDKLANNIAQGIGYRVEPRLTETK